MQCEDNEGPLVHTFGDGCAAILEFFIVHQGFTYAAKDMARMMNRDRKRVQALLDRLEKLGLVQKAAKDDGIYYSLASNEDAQLLKQLSFNLAKKRIEQELERQHAAEVPSTAK